MQTLYPPLNPSAAEDSAGPDGDGNDDVLSPELKENFEAIRALVREQRRPSDESQEDEEEVLRHKARHEKHESLKRKLALKTALAVESELACLRNGISELEALLAQQEGAAEAAILAVSFPSLPPVVPDYGSEDEEDRAAIVAVKATATTGKDQELVPLADPGFSNIHTS